MLEIAAEQALLDPANRQSDSNLIADSRRFRHGVLENPKFNRVSFKYRYQSATNSVIFMEIR
jgi:hypothetical protein